MDTFIFDLYNTLIDIRTDESRAETWAPVVRFCEERGVHTDWTTLRDLYEKCWAAMMSEREAAGKYSYPEGDICDVFKRMVRELGAEWSDETAAEAARCMRYASRVWLKLFDGTIELFAKLRAAGAKLYLLSNAQAVITLDEIEECGLSDKFDGTLISSDCGCRKPDSLFFKMLFDKYSLDKKKAVMVGDDKNSDGAGAKAFGIKYVCAEGGAVAVGDKLCKLARAK